ncbi:MAG: hypothetical protein HGB15_01020 [Chlorobaculum sp.]|nr:hypothetical protein [Chlorobaculum sp.]
MKRMPLGEAESAQNTKIARHEETRHQVYRNCPALLRSASVFQLRRLAFQISESTAKWLFLIVHFQIISQGYGALNVKPQG